MSSLTLIKINRTSNPEPRTPYFQMKTTAGFTLIELLLSLVGMAVIMLSVFALFSGGVKNWTTMEPQLTMRQEATDALYGKAGDKSGGMVNNIQSARVLLDGINTGATATLYARDMKHGTRTIGTISSSVIYFIKDDKQQVETNTPPGTFSATEDDVVCYYAVADSAGTYSSWSLRRDVYAPGTSTAGTITSSTIILKNMGNPARTGTGSYRIFTYYSKSGQEINPTEIVQNVQNKNIAYISINIQMNIDSDHDKKYGEDPLDGVNDDNDNKIDEDKPMDLSILTKVFPRMLWKDTPQ
ncbi:hypothetical protein AUJ95_03590 [Candidatus Desantisbacteria bacterium CG2_30_40_21]|uniref:Prepilin-type N-terminal cleavage/methylation domain-containing protein n=4 Tax=unclassified Candidatus Desantisiibacteriota TaxID=3106372 RepID=A0A2M7P144_9BACT|nr:MAG: hypothetical protein AUJ95_03590 [Candidatus Desantisbacteria bacterium CG2_30_40_21]PIP39247.1 MAG: hypothetical protein COX18_10740 [Candidatus Desantisbacteria bacterium CG23_combo_of_CG06-09_8_20_14_all_40_23]PIY19154.1 MAG: hypothetical protein COZ13_06790 [Candidatus Desantisbacteria bacterium CG_4_10_14_3_um_filter_40_18]PJB29293.1 MAG: hypothetical protein CO110_06550 [Candidatus Desantisbacteria bacterium CG_4_9_14_3_um_filter_40_11]